MGPRVSTNLLITGLDVKSVEGLVLNHVRKSRTPALGVAVAYVSIYGANFLKGLTSKTGINAIKIVTHTGDAITHPQALRVALSEGWPTRVLNPEAGIFHPKLIIGGERFDDANFMIGTKLLLVGSANLTKGGLRGNIECSLVRTDDATMPAAANAFRRLWELGADLTDQGISAYEFVFAERCRTRSAKDLEVLGIADETAVEVADLTELKKRKQPRSDQRSIATTAAAAAWTGLESFTGEYRFQVEFPRDAGEVLRRIIEPLGGETVTVLCDDGNVRSMRYRYYDDNAMFRLNVPNDTPGVAWARENHAGIAIVEAHPEGEVPLRFRVLRPGRDATDVIGRSVALGTWGRTPTRLYGWF